MAKKLTSEKARKILHDKNVHGKPLTEKQRKFFGAIAGGAKPYQDGGWLDKYDMPQAQNGIEGTMGGLTDIGFNHNGAWGGAWRNGGTTLQPPMAGALQAIPLMQMGGSLPGAVGFMYARTQSPAPSNGPYAKKTKASAQNGQEMKYYQEGLDFKPKTISQNGSKTLPNVNLTPNQKEPVYVSDSNDPRLRAYQDSLTAYNVGKEVAQGIGRGYDKYYQENWNRSRNRNDYEKYFVKNYEAGKLKYPLGGNDRIFGSEASRKLNEKDIKELATYDKNFSKLLKLKVRPQSALYSAELPPIISYKKPTQPVVLEEEPRFEKPIPIPRDTRDLGYTLPTPRQFTALELYKYNADTPTKFSFTSPTGKYNEQKTMYFPSKSALKSFVGGVRGATYQEGADYATATGTLQDGGDIPVDPMGYWNPENVGNPVIIPSNIITMEGVDQPLIGISDTGDVQYMEPGEDYEFDGEYVTEYPVAKGGVSVNNADAQPEKKLDQLLNFTNYNKPTKGGWLDKYQ